MSIGPDVSEDEKSKKEQEAYPVGERDQDPLIRVETAYSNRIQSREHKLVGSLGSLGTWAIENNEVSQVRAAASDWREREVSHWTSIWTERTSGLVEEEALDLLISNYFGGGGLRWEYCVIYLLNPRAGKLEVGFKVE